MRLLTLTTVAIFVTAGVLCGCGSDEGVDAATAGKAAGEFAYENPIFQSTWTIKASATGALSAPSFSWPATNHSHVVCALFDERMSVKDNTITNTHRLVWMWHSGLKGGREGNVQWKDGVADPQTGQKAAALKSGTYFWAVWSVDAQGVPVASTVENKHEVQ